MLFRSLKGVVVAVEANMSNSGVGQHLQYPFEQSVAGSQDRDHHRYIYQLRGFHRDEGRLNADLIEGQFSGHFVCE